MKIADREFAHQEIILRKSRRLSDDFLSIHAPKFFVTSPIRQILAIEEFLSVGGSRKYR